MVTEDAARRYRREARASEGRAGAATSWRYLLVGRSSALDLIGRRTARKETRTYHPPVTRRYETRRLRCR
jgi:hypothetical protein